MEGEESLALTKQFERAVSYLNEQKGLKFGNDIKLQFYGYYKQAMQGPCTTKKPGFFEIEGRAKWDAWNKLGQMTPKEAKQGYTALLKRLVPTWDAGHEKEAVKESKEGEEDVPIETTERSDGTRQRDGMLVFSVPVNQDESSEDEDTKDLCYYAMEGKVEKVIELLDSKPPVFTVGYQDDDGMTALHWAADRGRLEVVKELIARGANPNQINADGQTALHSACQAENLKIVELLLAAGANASIVDSEGESPLDVTDNEAIKKLLSSK